MNTEKDALRRRMLAARAACAPHQRAEASRRMQTHLLASLLWRTSCAPLVYWPIRHEPDAALLLENALQTGKTLLLPRCDPHRAGVMRAVVCRDLSALTPGRFGIPEPPAANSETPPEPDLVIVPGCAFDRQGGRLGYGKGYYDRFLAARKAIPLVGFAFAFQVVDSLPLDPWDRRMDALCLETGVFACPLAADLLN